MENKIDINTEIPIIKIDPEIPTINTVIKKKRVKKVSTNDSEIPTINTVKKKRVKKEIKSNDSELELSGIKKKKRVKKEIIETLSLLPLSLLPHETSTIETNDNVDINDATTIVENIEKNEKILCNICCDEFISTSFIKCYCEFECCQKCVQRFIIEKNEFAQCMNEKCHKFFSRAFMFDKLQRKFLDKEYKEHKEIILLEKELTYLPIAQLELERLLKIAFLKELKSKIRTNFDSNLKLFDSTFKQFSHSSNVLSQWNSSFRKITGITKEQMEDYSNQVNIEIKGKLITILENYCDMIIQFLMKELENHKEEYSEMITDFYHIYENIKKHNNEHTSQYNFSKPSNS